LGVQVQAATAAEASSQEATTMSNVVEAVRKAGVEERDIQTSELNLEPVYENRQNDAPRLTGFRISNVVQVDVRRTDTIGKVLDAALGAGANRVDSISFFRQDDSVERALALRQAAQAAAAKAKTLAAALGITLDGVASVTEGVMQSEPIYAGGGMAMRSMAATPISAGQLSVTATVTLQYRLRNE
ncbi:MAG: SIMPL domain-containing protein, partial [Armatimonadota bacterium]|nr:SIMPL domain-containing protein [Armatimonadota bacterium]